MSTTSLFDTEDNPLADWPSVLPIPWYKGMKLTLHGHTGEFEVVDWEYHVGHPDENPGLKVVLRPA